MIFPESLKLCERLAKQRSNFAVIRMYPTPPTLASGFAQIGLWVCAIALQQELTEHGHEQALRLRIGVPIGDVVIKKATVRDDGERCLST